MLKPCEKWNARLSAWLDGEGSTTERLVVEQHLAACPACRAAAEVLRCDAQDVTAALQARKATDSFLTRVMGEVAVTKMGGEKPEKTAAVEPEQPRQSSPGWFGVLMRWGLGVIVIAVVASVLFPVFPKAREKARESTCLNNVRQQVLAITMAAQDNGGLYPDERTVWTDVNFPPKSLIDPTYSRKHGNINSYGYNVRLSNKVLEDFDVPPQELLVVADCKSSDNLIRSVADIDFRHSGKASVAFADGHVDFINHDEASAILHGKSPAMEQLRTIEEINSSASEQPTIVPPTRNYGLAEKLQIAYTASLALQSDDVQRSMEQAELLFLEFEGFVLKSEYHREDDERASALVNGRVPSGKLGPLLVELDRLGRLESRTVNGEDLTAIHISQVEKLGDLAETQGNLTAIENRAKPNEALQAESSRVKASGEASSTRVEQYKLKSKVVLADVTVQLSSLPRSRAKINPFKGSAAKSYSALKAFGTWLFTGLIIPLGIWLPVWGPLAVLGIVLRRRYRR